MYFCVFAGQGPDGHCKHIQTVLWGLVQFSSTGIIDTEETCTQQLQTFHKTKKMTGSPSKTQNLNLGCGDFDYDPRPEKYRGNAGYPSHVRNLVINFQNTGPMPIQMTIEPANPHAVNLDHQYVNNTLEEQFLINNQITQITARQVDDIQANTMQQCKSDDWKMERCKRLTSSNFGRICTATKLTDKPTLAFTFTKYTKITSPSIRHGNAYEDVAVRKFESDNGIKTSKCGLFVCQTHPFIAASPDRLLNDNKVVEVKCPFTAKGKVISPTSVPWLKMKDTGELMLDTRHQYYYQIQGQLYCTDRQQCILVVYTLKDQKYIEIERDNEFISNMVSQLEEFFHKYFKQALLKRFLYKDYYSYSFQPTQVY